MIVGHDKFDAMQTARLQPQQEIPPARRLSRLASSTASTWRRPSQSMPIAISTAWLSDHAGLAHPLVARVEDQIGEGFGQRASAKSAKLASRAWFIALIEGSRKAVAAQLLGHRRDVPG